MSKIVKLKQLKIMLKTNISDTPEALTYSKIYNPYAREASHENNDEKKSEMKEYPFFTESVPYPEETLKGKSYKDVLKIFFNKDSFMKTIIAPNQQNISETSNNEIIEKNIMIMLDVLFPTSYPSSDNINTSYNKILLKTPYKFSVDTRNITSGIFESSVAEYSYLKLNGKTYTISEVIWMNDLLNHPVYKKLIDMLIEYNEWAIEKSDHVKDEKKKLTQKFIQKMQPTNEKSININDEDIYLIKKQKKIFTKDEFESELQKIFAYFVSVPSEEIIDEIINKIIEKSDAADKRRSDISKSELYNSLKSSFTGKKFKNVQDIENENVDSIMNKIYTTSNENNEVETDGNDDLIKSFLNFVYASFKKYMNSKEFIERSRSFSDIKKFDNDIDQLILKINDLNTLDIANIDMIVNNIESIYELFEKIKSISNELKPITNKINELSILSKEIKALIMVDKYLLSPNHGIMVQYEKYIENESDRKIFMTEIEKKKYEPFKKLVEMVQSTFIKNEYKSANKDLQELLDNYFQYKNSEIKEKILDVVVNLKRKKPSFGPLWNVSVASYHSEEDTIYKKMEIYLHMVLIDGELNASNAKFISCEFSNNQLIQMFEKLTSKGNNYDIDKSNKIFTMPVMNSEPTSNDNQPNPTTTPPPVEMTEQKPEEKSGGKRSRRNVRRNKKTRKIKWRMY
jgi:hypothetical protein